MTDTEKISDIQPQRLCSEIQLFDLCDLDSCTFKDGRFCTEAGLLSRFEKISEQEQRVPERYMSEESDDETDDFDDDFDDALAEENPDDIDEGWDT